MATHGEGEILDRVRSHFATLEDGHEIEEMLIAVVKKARENPNYWRSPSRTLPLLRQSFLPKQNGHHKDRLNSPVAQDQL